jgi:hypothetical protein
MYLYLVTRDGVVGVTLNWRYYVQEEGDDIVGTCGREYVVRD